MTTINAVFNPSNLDIGDLPVIYGFNNGGSPGCYTGQLIAEDGMPLGQHVCSAEINMPHDLGILEGTREDRHETFRKHYPDGYLMAFVSSKDVPGHDGLKKAFELNAEKGKV